MVRDSDAGCGGVLACSDCTEWSACSRRVALVSALRTVPARRGAECVFAYAAGDSLRAGRRAAMLRNVRALGLRLTGSDDDAEVVLERTERTLASTHRPGNEGYMQFHGLCGDDSMEALGSALVASAISHPSSSGADEQAASLSVVDIEDLEANDANDACGGILGCADCELAGLCDRRAALVRALRAHPKPTVACTLSYVADESLASGLGASALRIGRAFERIG